MEWIDNIVLGLIETYETNDPYELSDLMEITIEKVDKDFNLLCGNNSIYYRELYGNEVIFIRNDLNKNHEEFYLRHELGHSILHTHIKNSLNAELINIDKLEKQANYFALKLSQVNFDEIELEQLNIEQISSCLNIPLKPLLQLVNLH